MAFDFTAWPVAADITDLLASANITLPGTVTSDVIDLRIAAAASRMERDTGRTFLPVTEDRFFSGSGTSKLVVDDYVTINTVTLYVMPSTGSGQITLNYFKEISRKGYPKNEIYIIQGPPNQPIAWYSRFPEGNENIKINADWGYGSTIPQDVWEAVLLDAAGQLANANQASEAGVLVEWTDGDVNEKYGGNSSSILSSMLGWDKKRDEAARRYRRSLMNQHQRSKPPLY